MEIWLVSLSHSLFFSLHVPVSLFHSVCLYVYLFISVSLCLSLCICAPPPYFHTFLIHTYFLFFFRCVWALQNKNGTIIRNNLISLSHRTEWSIHKAASRFFMPGECFCPFSFISVQVHFPLGKWTYTFISHDVIALWSSNNKKKAEKHCFCLFVQYFFFQWHDRRVIMHSCITDHDAIGEEKKNLELKSNLETLSGCISTFSVISFFVWAIYFSFGKFSRKLLIVYWIGLGLEVCFIKGMLKAECLSLPQSYLIQFEIDLLEWL